MKFYYSEKDSRLFGKILAPFIYMEILSKDGLWCGIDKVLVDTGADITLIPRNIGEILVSDITTGSETRIKGIADQEIKIFIHEMKIRVAGKEFKTKLAISEKDNVPALLGRYEALDLFTAQFFAGKELNLE